MYLFSKCALLFSMVVMYVLRCTKNEIFHKGFLQEMWPNSQEIFTEEILSGKLQFLCSVNGEGIYTELSLLLFFLRSQSFQQHVIITFFVSSYNFLYQLLNLSLFFLNKFLFWGLFFWVGKKKKFFLKKMKKITKLEINSQKNYQKREKNSKSEPIYDQNWSLSFKPWNLEKKW